MLQNLHLLLELRVELREEEQLGPPLLPVRALRELLPRLIIHQAQLLRPSHIHEFQVLPPHGRLDSSLVPGLVVRGQG
jgi:hypothetical protein